MYKHFILLAIVFIEFSCFNLINAGNHNVLKLKNLKCHVNEEFFSKHVCKIKPTRDGAGLLTILATAKKPAHDVWYHGKLFYKYRVFRPWMIEFDIDVCAHKAGRQTSSIFGKLYMEVVKTFVPKYVNNCPYQGEVGVANLNVSKMFQNILPQVVPKGTYRLWHHFHTSDNKTYGRVEVTVDIDSVEPLKSFDMGH